MQRHRERFDITYKVVVAAIREHAPNNLMELLKVFEDSELDFESKAGLKKYYDEYLLRVGDYEQLLCKARELSENFFLNNDKATQKEFAFFVRSQEKSIQSLLFALYHENNSHFEKIKNNMIKG